MCVLTFLSSKCITFNAYNLVDADPVFTAKITNEYAGANGVKLVSAVTLSC